MSWKVVYAGMGMIHINRDRRSLGQFTEQDVSNGLANGQFLPGDLAWQEGMDNWQPLSTFANLPTAGTVPATLPPPPPLAPAITPIQTPGKIQFDECLSKAWECYKTHWGILILATLIFFALSMVIQAPMQVSQAIFERFMKPGFHPNPWIVAPIGFLFLFFAVVTSGVSAILSAGFMLFFIRTLRNGKAAIEDIFLGFRGSSWIQILLALVVWMAVVFVLALVLFVPGFYLTVTTKSPIPIFVSVGFLVIPVIYFAVGLGFVFPLILDRKLGFVEAIVTSLKTVHQQWFQAFGLLILVFLLTMLGFLACCVGALATMPLAYLVWCQGYRQLFGDGNSPKL